MKRTLFAIVCVALFFAMFFAVPAAYADFDVSVDADGKFIIVFYETYADVIADTLYFSGSIANMGVYTPEDGGVFYSIGKKFVERLKTDGYTIYGKDPAGATPNTGNVYFVVAGVHEGKRIAGAFPVEFSPFGVGFHSRSGGAYNVGTVIFNDDLLRGMERPENLW